MSHRISRRRFFAWGALAPSLMRAKEPASYWVYLGTYTRKASKGIYVARLEATAGRLTAAELAAESSNPSFLAIHPQRPFLYAVNEAPGSNSKEGLVTAFSIDKATGKLTKLNSVSSKGEGPCHLSVDRTGRAVVVANYGSGSTSALRIQADGSLAEGAGFIQHQGSSVNPQRQRGPHAHSANISPDNRFVVVADLGLDRVLVYRLDPANAGLTPNDPPYISVKPGSGPRHFTFHPKGKFAYVINELASTVTAFRWNSSRGSFTELETVSTLPPGVQIENTTAEVVAHPNGKFLYGSNRGHNSIAVFSIDPGKGTLKLVGNVPTQGEIPRNFAIEPGGRWLLVANQNSDSVVLFRINPDNGMLTHQQTIEAPTPVCVRFVAV